MANMPSSPPSRHTRPIVQQILRDAKECGLRVFRIPGKLDLESVRKVTGIHRDYPPNLFRGVSVLLEEVEGSESMTVYGLNQAGQQYLYDIDIAKRD